MKSEFLQHFEVLKKIGIWDELEYLEKEIRESDRLFSEVLEMYSRHSPETLIDFVISCFLDKFIPSTLLFLIEEPSTTFLSAYLYRNLKPALVYTDLRWYYDIKPFLDHERSSLSFSKLKEKIPPAEFKAIHEQYAPELLFPIRGIGGVYGLILFGSKVVDGSYTRRELQYIEKLMLFFSVCLQNTLHHYSSITGSKTGLYNHAYFMKRLEEELGKSRRYGKGIGIILMDLDHFKQFNDTYGHLAGDVVLMEIGRILKTLVRSEDVLSRFGGEEFILLVEDCKICTLIHVAERLRITVEKIPILYEGKELRITISMGCTYLPPGRKETPQALISQADTALYRSKQLGRNRTTLYKGGLLYRGLLHRSLEESRRTRVSTESIIPGGE